MIVVTKSFGQLGNRLLLYAHLIAAARHYGVTLANPCFAGYAHLFPATQDDLWCRYPLQPGTKRPSQRSRRLLAEGVYLGARALGAVGLRRFPYSIVRVRLGTKMDLAGEEFAELVRRGRPVLVDGWQFRSQPLLEQHAGAVREHFRIQPENQQRVRDLIAGLRSQGDIVVGVHIRHGDYATYLDGQYYYPVSKYVDAMKRVERQLAPNKVVFLVCSNAKHSREEFGDLSIVYGNGDIIEDMYSFAEVDFLMGPPSTYTLWASFYGQVPLCHLETADQQIDTSAIEKRSAA